MPAKIPKKLRYICKLWENREARLEETSLPRRESCDRCMARDIRVMERVREPAPGFQSLTEAVDTTTAAGRMIMQMLGSFACIRAVNNP